MSGNNTTSQEEEERLEHLRVIVNTLYHVSTRHKRNKVFRDMKAGYNNFVIGYKRLSDEEKGSLSQQVRKKNFLSVLSIGDISLNISSFFTFCTPEETLSLKSYYCKLLHLNEPSLMTEVEISFMEGKAPVDNSYGGQLLKQLPKIIEDLLNPSPSNVNEDFQTRIISSVDKMFNMPSLTSITSNLVSQFNEGQTPTDSLRKVIDVMSNNQEEITSMGKQISENLFSDEKRNT